MAKLFGFKLPAAGGSDKNKNVISPVPANDEDKSDFYIHLQYLHIVRRNH